MLHSTPIPGTSNALDAYVTGVSISTLQDGIAVKITLGGTSDVLSNGGGPNEVSRIAAMYENAVLNAVPEVGGVIVVDANNITMGTNTRN